MRLSPSNVQIIGNELAIAWNDGAESYLTFEAMRRACPCAACGGEPDVLGKVVRPAVQYSPASFRLRRYQMVGGYALQPTWEDGHSSGLYSFDYIRCLANAPAARDANPVEETPSR